MVVFIQLHIANILLSSLLRPAKPFGDGPNAGRSLNAGRSCVLLYSEQKHGPLQPATSDGCDFLSLRLYWQFLEEN